MENLLISDKNKIEKLSTLLYLEQQERKKLASEFHQSKSVIHLALMVIGKLEKSATYQKELELLKELLNDYVAEFRKTYYELHPPFVEDIGLQKALMIMTKNYSESAGLSVNFNVNQLEKINNFVPKQIAIFKTLKNIIKLSVRIKATRTDLNMKIKESELEISVINHKIENAENNPESVELLNHIEAQLTWIKAKVNLVTDWKNIIAFKIDLREN